MGQLIDDLLALARVSSTELNRQRVSLSTIAKTVVDELRRSDPTREIETVVQDSVYGHADPGLLRIALENLLGNAWKFTSTTPAPRIEFGVHGESDGLVYYVRDNGAGFDMAYTAQLLNPFRRLHSDNEFPGTGIGLATVQRIIVRHGGRVWADAKVDEGANFYFTLGAELE